MAIRVTTGAVGPEEEELEGTLRPRRLDEFVGQELKETLGVVLTAAKARGEALDHVLLSGPPGLGKTTLAHIIARGDGRRHPHVARARRSSASGDLAAILTNLGAGDVLFIDEIHRLPPRRRGDPLPGDGGLPHRPRHRQGRRAPGRVSSTCSRSRSSARRRARGCSRRRCATASASTLPARLLRRPRTSQTIVAPLGRDPRRRRRAGRRREIAAALAGHAANREPAPPARPRLRRGARTTARSRSTSRARRSTLLEVDDARPRRDRPASPARDRREVRRRAGRALDARRLARRGARHDRGRLRAVPPAARPDPAHPARPDRDRARARPDGPQPLRRGEPALLRPSPAVGRPSAIAARRPGWYRPAGIAPTWR